MLGTTRFLGAAMAAGLFFLGAGHAAAAPLVCDVVTADECQITMLHDLGGGGTFEVDRSLHIFGPGGELRTNPGSTLALGITGGLTIDAGGKITGNAAAGNSSGATITITATGAVVLGGDGVSGAVISADQIGGACSGGGAGNISIRSTSTGKASIKTLPASRISANARCTAGDIEIVATRGGVIINGLVESASTLTGTGAVQRPGGGPITISASCTLTIKSGGRVSSRGRDPGADLVHLEAGGDVVVLGVVESTGPGHAVPNQPANYCSGQKRPDKPADSTACVEIWAGGSLVIDGGPSNSGEINADTAQGGGSAMAWIDLFAKGDIAITGAGAGPYAAGASPYAVHANQFTSNSSGGIISIKSKSGKVTLAGQAIQADGGLSTTTRQPTPGGIGGVVTVKASGDVDLGSASVRARGANVGGGPQAGGEITVTSLNGHVVGVAPGEMRADGGGGQPTPDPGFVKFQGCDAAPPAVSYLGASVPPAVTASAICGGEPEFSAYVVFIDSFCATPPPCDPATCPPPPCDPATCPPPPCDPATCPPPPCDPATCPPPPCDPATCPPPPCDPATCPPPCEGGACLPPLPFCDLDSVRAVMDQKTGRFPGNKGADLVVDLRTQSLQTALNTASDVNNDGYIIIGVIARDGGVPGGQGKQEVLVSRAYPVPFALIGCAVTLVDPNFCDGRAPVRVLASATSPEFPAGSGTTLYFQEITTTGSKSAPGWQVEGDGRYLEKVGAQGNMLGIKVVGNANAIHQSFARDNFTGGVVVEGNGNTLIGVKAFDNAGGDGVRITGNRNTIAKSKAGAENAGNGGNGITVVGKKNLIRGNRALANEGDGINVSGGTAGKSNVLESNVAGGVPSGANAGNGIVLDGAGPGAGGPVDLLGNTSTSNARDGFKVTGTGHVLKGNVSGSPTPNVVCQYDVASGNINATGNTASGGAVPGLNGSPFPGGCF